ncbi:hypothetical protein LLG10_07695 [bacterium]|nr:hypothetical protein [bacterium]
MRKKLNILFFVVVFTFISFNRTPTYPSYSAEKEGYAIVIDQENTVFDKFIAEHQEAYRLIVVNLKKAGVNNQGSQILKHLKSVYESTPFRYLVFFEKVNYLLSVDEYNSNQFYGKDWTNQPVENITYRSVFPYSRQIHEGSVIQVGIITEDWLKTDWLNQTEISLNMTAPRQFDDYLMHTAKCITYSSHLSDWGEYVKNLKKQAQTKGIPTVLGMEDRSSYQRELSKGDYQLLLEPTTKAIQTNAVSFVCSSLEKIQVNVSKYTVEDFNKHPDYITTHVWRDDDKNQYVDPDGKEITIETIYDMTQKLDSKKRMLIYPIIYPPNHINQFYLTLVNLGEVIPDSKYLRTDSQELKYNYCTVWNEVMAHLIEGKTIGQAVFESYDSFVAKYGEEYYPDSLVIFHTYAQMVIYGPPEMTMQDLAEKARLEILPKEIQETSEIIIPTKETQTEIIIKNTGSATLRYVIAFDENRLELSPSKGSVESGQEVKILLKINKSSVHLFSTLKRKFSVITIQTNAGNKTILVKWNDI